MTHGKTTTDVLLGLDVRALKRAGVLMPGYSGTWTWARSGRQTAAVRITAHEDGIELDYRTRTSGDTWAPMRYRVRLAWTPNTLGGRLPFFLCPGHGCGRRVQILHGGAVFACRHCHRLAYMSQREDEADRAMRRADKIRERLGWVPGIANPPGGKPKWMRWPTYWRLCAEHERHARRALAATWALPMLRGARGAVEDAEDTAAGR